MMQPKYDLEKIKCATDGPTFDKAVALYESGKVMHFEEEVGAYSAVVQGRKPYRVSVEPRRYDHGQCKCYLGQHNTLCKHMVAVVPSEKSSSRFKHLMKTHMDVPSRHAARLM